MNGFTDTAAPFSHDPAASPLSSRVGPVDIMDADDWSDLTDDHDVLGVFYALSA